jgi:hypothetical protein
VRSQTTEKFRFGFAAVYIPSFIDLFNGIWPTDQQGHGPIVLAVAAWLMFRRWPQVRASAPAPTGALAS